VTYALNHYNIYPAYPHTIQKLIVQDEEEELALYQHREKKRLKKSQDIHKQIYRAKILWLANKITIADVYQLVLSYLIE